LPAKHANQLPRHSLPAAGQFLFTIFTAARSKNLSSKPPVCYYSVATAKEKIHYHPAPDSFNFSTARI
jgi:hypothetical protein